jgi:tRNA(adenine34) deaminase
MISHEYFMKFALNEASKTRKAKDVPVGAVVVHNNKIIGKGYNKVEQQIDTTCHAELTAIKLAIKKLNTKNLTGCSLYVTLEPCPMCAGAIVLARFKTVVFGASDPKSGACGSVYNIIQDERLNHRCEVISGILESKCSDLLTDFFTRLRAGK